MEMGVKKLWYLRENVYSLDFCILAEKSGKSNDENGKHNLTITVFLKKIRIGLLFTPIIIV